MYIGLEAVVTLRMEAGEQSPDSCIPPTLDATSAKGRQCPGTWLGTVSMQWGQGQGLFQVEQSWRPEAQSPKRPAAW